MPILRRLKLGYASIILVAAVVAAACSGGEEVQTVRVQEDVAVKPPLPVFEHPITGVLYEGPQPWQQRPPLSIKVENSTSARPQSGLDNADLVIELLTEGGITRFMTVFQSHDAPRVGPVRSVRRVDSDLLAGIGGLFGYSGGTPPNVAAVRAVPGVTDVGVDRATGAYTRLAGRPAPHNLYTSTDRLWEGRSGEPPAPLFTFLPEGQDRPPGQAGSSVRFAFSYREQVQYSFDPEAGVYRRFQGGGAHVVDNGSHISPSNVLIQMVTVTLDATANSTVIGEGHATLLTAGQVYQGRWTRSSAGQPTQFVDEAGNDFLLERGQTWIHLVPKQNPVHVE